MEQFKKSKKTKTAMRCVLIAMTGVLILTMVYDLVQRDWIHATCNLIWVVLASFLVSIGQQNDDLLDILERYDELTDKQQDRMKEQSALIGVLKAELEKKEKEG